LHRFPTIVKSGSLFLRAQIPSWNLAYRIHGKGMYKTATAKAFQEAVAWSYRGEYFDGPVSVEISFRRCPPIDVDNACKLVLDALQGKAYETDRQVSQVSIRREKCAKGEDCLQVIVEPLALAV